MKSKFTHAGTNQIQIDPLIVAPIQPAGKLGYQQQTIDHHGKALKLRKR